MVLRRCVVMGRWVRFMTAFELVPTTDHVRADVWRTNSDVRSPASGFQLYCATTDTVIACRRFLLSVSYDTDTGLRILFIPQSFLANIYFHPFIYHLISRFVGIYLLRSNVTPSSFVAGLDIQDPDGIDVFGQHGVVEPVTQGIWLRSGADTSRRHSPNLSMIGDSQGWHRRR